MRTIFDSAIRLLISSGQMSLDSCAEEILFWRCGGVAFAMKCREAWKSHRRRRTIITA